MQGKHLTGTASPWQRQLFDTGAGSWICGVAQILKYLIDAKKKIGVACDKLMI